MKIGFIWHCPYPWDVRLEKIMKACVQNGHQVSLVCKGKGASPKSENLEEIRIDRVYPPKAFSSKRAAKVAGFPLFFNPVWISAVNRFLGSQELDLVVVRDLPLAMLVVVLARVKGLPVVMDMAENYPAALVAYQNPLYKPFLLGNAWLPKQYENFSLRLLRHTIVVTQEQAQRLCSQGIRREKLTVVGNTPERKFFPAGVNQAAPTTSPIGENAPNLLFVGKLDAHRGAELVVRAMPNLLKEFPLLTLTLVGDGTERAKVIELAKTLGVAANVDLPGWVEFSKIWDYIGRSNVCLIPHLRSEHTDTTLPNKLFDYMAMGKPVVSSDCAPIERVIRETDCGLTFESGNVAGLFKTLQQLLSNPQASEIKGQNGRAAVLDKYNWDVDQRVLLDLLESIAPRLTEAEMTSTRA